MMNCTHEKEGLVWEVELLLPWAKSYSYKYAIVRKSGHEVQVGELAGKTRVGYGPICALWCEIHECYRL